MERKIGETFEYEGKKLQVKAASKDSCEGCILDGKCTRGKKAITGFCERGYRNDEKRVIFVEVQERPQETEEIKERKVGEVFEYQGEKLKVAEELVQGDCVGCYFFEKYDCGAKRRIIGECEREKRNDNQGIIFVDIIDDLKRQSQEQAEQPQDEQLQKLNLCEVLKYCPQGETFWSPMLGDVALYDIDNEKKRVYVLLKTDTDIQMYINADATLTLGDVTSQEIMLYPSREQRDWAKVKYSRKERFDPKTLNPFDKVVVRNIQSNTWRIEYFSHIDERCKPYPFYCLGDNFAYCIPYNDDTKHLVGTKEEAPEYYKYWKD